jgi:hypothetical protein
MVQKIDLHGFGALLAMHRHMLNYYEETMRVRQFLLSSFFNLAHTM